MLIVGNHDFHVCDGRFYFLDILLIVTIVITMFSILFWVFVDIFGSLSRFSGFITIPIDCYCYLHSYLFLSWFPSVFLWLLYINSCGFLKKHIFRVACDFHLYLQFTSRQILSVVLLFSDPGYDFFLKWFSLSKKHDFWPHSRVCRFFVCIFLDENNDFSCLLSFSKVERYVTFFQNSGFCFRIMVFTVSDVITVRLFCYSLLTICCLWS